ncbi:MAG: radical SAM-associated putative lipoprotein [Muribaculaceae bacterium]|nr:radical SAM-associated putative lipoprotein [Muribaculaceae bacterium]
MKFINLKLSSLLTSICSALLSLLGFSCSSPTEDMYGTPTGDFEIKGSVTSEEGKAVADAEIRVTSSDAPSERFSFTTVATDAEGQYIAIGESYANREVKMVCIPSSPELEADSVIVKLNYNKDHASSWYEGEAKETVDFKLKPKVSIKQ